MFTGLVETIGNVGAIARRGEDFVLDVVAHFAGASLALGESIAVNGACLTVVSFTSSGFAAQASPETLAKTNLGRLKTGDRVNLERALRLGDRLGGHLVLGHVDGIGRLVDVRRDGNAHRLTSEAPPELLPLIVDKGSITLDGVSLTVNEVSGHGFSVEVVPFTARHVALIDRPRGWQLNLEVDILGKYVARLLATGRVALPGETSSSPGLTLDTLRAGGFLDD